MEVAAIIVNWAFFISTRIILKAVCHVFVLASLLIVGALTGGCFRYYI